MSQDPIEMIFGTKFCDTNIVFTPQNIAEDMINMIPEDFWTPDIKILDIYCKTGRFLKVAYDKLFNSPYLAYMPDQERRTHILSNQLYGICDNSMCIAVAQRLLYGRMQLEKCNTTCIENLTSMVKNTDRRFIYEALRKEFNTMQFDCVIGNPPYNKGMDLDFVDLGFKISKQYTIMITPAKWQTAEANQKVASKNMNYEQFRKEIVPHIKYVHFYPDCKDVFDIMQADGISWFLIDKSQRYTECTVENSLNANKIINSVIKRKGDLLNGDKYLLQGRIRKASTM